MVFALKKREYTYTANGNKILYGLKKNAKTENITDLENFFRERFYKNEQIREAPVGFYTWILKKDGTFYAAKTFTKQEIGTLHANLKMFTNTSNNTGDNVIAAGELEIKDGKIISFNLLSGTYMKTKFEGKKLLEDKIELRDELVTIMNKLFTGYGFVPNFLSGDESIDEEERIGGIKIIEKANITTSPENIEMLNSMFVRNKFLPKNTFVAGTRKKQFKSKRRYKRSVKKLK